MFLWPLMYYQAILFPLAPHGMAKELISVYMQIMQRMLSCVYSIQLKIQQNRIALKCNNARTVYGTRIFQILSQGSYMDTGCTALTSRTMAIALIQINYCLILMQ